MWIPCCATAAATAKNCRNDTIHMKERRMDEKDILQYEFCFLKLKYFGDALKLLFRFFFLPLENNRVKWDLQSEKYYSFRIIAMGTAWHSFWSEDKIWLDEIEKGNCESCKWCYKDKHGRGYLK